MPMAWVTRWKYEMAPKPSKPGVWKLRQGGWYCRARVTDAKTGRMREVSGVRDDASADDAYAWLRAEVGKVRSGRTQPLAERQHFDEFAAQVLERKILHGDIWSPKGQDKWKKSLEHHLVPAFGDMFVDAITAEDIASWYDKIAERVLAGEVAASSATTHLGILKQILPAVTAGRRSFKTPPGRETYTEESPNALKPDDVPKFLDLVLKGWPQHYAMVVLGFSTGLRPSSMRPLRRTGPKADVRWAAGEIVIRRSQTRGEAIDRTKTDSTRGVIPAPSELVDVLRWHVDRLTEKQLETDLLFPSEAGGFRSGSVLAKPFEAVAEAMHVGYEVSARAMRRTFQDLCRACDVRRAVAMAVSGHATEAMNARYSTISMDERRAGIAKVISIMGVRRAA